MEDMEKTTTIQSYEHSDENAEVGYLCKDQKSFSLQGQPELNTVVPESAYETIEDKPYQQNELSAVDLRITRPPNTVNPSVDNIKYYKNKKDGTGTTLFFQNDSLNNSYIFNVSSDSQVKNSFENPNYSATNLEPYEDGFGHVMHNQCTSHQTTDSQKKYTFKKHTFNGADFYDSQNNVDMVLLVDQETQTQMKESKESSVQTDKETNKCTYSLVKQKYISNAYYSCWICQQLYTSKSSCDRHARTHVKNRNNSVVTSLHITQQSNFMILKENICKSQSRPSLPITLQKPNLTKFWCVICCKSFSSQIDRDVHRDNFVIDEFPLTKCKECHVQFFTLGALNEHVKFVHETCMYKCNAYCCVFCNESFESSYSFQLHLDEHLSTIINY